MPDLKMLAIVALAACSESKKPAPAPPPPAAVAVQTVEKRDVALYIEAVGSLDGYDNADIRARVKGYLQSQKFKDGSQVTAGQTLFTIEPTEYQATAAAAQAALTRAKVAIDRNTTDLARNQGLLKAGMISQQDVDNATSALADAQAQAKAAEAQVAEAQLNLSYATIKSPISGFAGIAQVRVGNLVGQDGPTLLTTVSQLDPIRVNVPLSEVDYVKYPERFAHLEGRDLAWAKAELARLDAVKPDPAGAKGATKDDGGVEIDLVDGSVYPHRAVIVAVNRQIDATTGTTQLQALVSNPDGVLRPGEYAKVRIRRQNEGHDVVVVPEKALISVQGTYSVAVVGADKKVALKRLELGPSVHGERVVLSGLVGGEQIVVDGLQKVTDGATVDPHPATAAEAASAGSGAGSGSGSGSGAPAAPPAPPAAGSGSGSAKGT